jgi:hypothetical protein
VDTGVDATDGATPVDAADAGVDATDAADAASPVDAAEAGDDAGDATADVEASDYDAFTFPDAQSLSGLRIGFVGNPGSASTALLIGYLSTSATVTRIDYNGSPSAINATVLGAFDVVVLDQLQRSYSGAEAQALADWVTAGGGVLSLTGYTGSGPDGANPNSLFVGLGVQYVTGQIFSNANVVALVPHPVMQGVASLTFSGGYPVSITNDAGTDVVVAMIDATNVALVAGDFGQGRFLAWGDEWIEYDGEFSGHQGTERFWNNAMLWLKHKL